MPSAVSAAAHDLPEVHAALLDYVDYMTKAVKVPSAVFARAKNAISSVSAADASGLGEAEASGEAEKVLERKIVEATATIAGYNMVTRVIMALDVGGLEGEEVPVPSIV